MCHHDVATIGNPGAGGMRRGDHRNHLGGHHVLWGALRPVWEDKPGGRTCTRSLRSMLDPCINCSEILHGELGFRDTFGNDGGDI